MSDGLVKLKIGGAKGQGQGRDGCALFATVATVSLFRYDLVRTQEFAQFSLVQFVKHVYWASTNIIK